MAEEAQRYPAVSWSYDADCEAIELGLGRRSVGRPPDGPTPHQITLGVGKHKDCYSLGVTVP